MRASTANSPELTQARMSRDYLSKVFAHRLSLTAVAQSMIQGWLEERFAGARLRAHTGWIGVIQAGGGYTQLITLSDALIKRCMSGEALNFTPGHHQLLTRSGERVFEAVTDAITVDDIEQMLNALAPGVLEGFAERLVDYWNERVSDGSAHSRWDAVGRQLRACLMTARQNPPLSSEHARALLGQGDEHTQVWSDRADREALGQPHVLRIYQVFAVQNERQGEWLPLLVLQRQVQGQRVTLLYVPALNLLTLDNLDALGNLLPRYMNHYLPGVPVHWVLREPEGNVFDALAQTLLERQLRSLYRVDWSALPEIGSYEQLFISLTSPLAWFDPDALQQPHEEQLPLWLQLAGSADRLVYGQWLERLQQTTGGASFLDGLDSIDVYARNALRRQMRLDRPGQAIIDPDDYQLTFERTQGGTVGWTQRTARTLTQWSLENPFVTAYASVQISHQTQPESVPGWLTAAYLKQLIERVDVGKHYPTLLERALISDPVDCPRRRRLFVDQMTIQLPMRAFENSLRRRHGFTRTGALVVRTMLQEDPLKRVLSGEVIVARPLAFLLHAGGRAHKADNLFVIGPRDNSPLPHILYRPDHVDAVLQQFPSRQALLDEIARVDSDLQRLVLQRLPDASRALFGNGGFLRPHVQRFLPGDEYDAQPTSSPVLLSDEVITGDFLAVVFDENAHSLWQLAVKQSASNEALRWAVFKNDLWQLFNALLPMIRGPVAVAGWLFQTFKTFRAVLALPPDASQEDAAAALTELIGSLAGLLLSPVVKLDERLGLSASKSVTTGTVHTTDVIPVGHVRQPTSTFAWPRSLADITAMDYSWANSRLKLNPQQQAKLETFQWAPGRGERGPDRPAVFSADSPVRGQVQVLRDGGAASQENYTLLDSKVYGVTAVEGGWRIADLRDPQRLGPWLRKSPDDVWKVDLGLRLLGGQKRSPAARRYAQVERKSLLIKDEYDAAVAELIACERKVKAAESLCEKAHSSAEGLFTDQHRRDARMRFLAEMEKQEGAQQKQLNLLIRKNSIKPMDGFEREHCAQLKTMLETMRRRMYVLTFNRREEQLPPARIEQVTAQFEDADVTVSQAAERVLNEEAHKIGEFQQSMVNLSFWERVFYQRLQGVPGYKSFVGDLAPSSYGAPLDWRTLQLQTLKQMIWRRRPTPEEHDDCMRVKGAIDEAIQSAQSQKTIDEAGVLSVQQRIEGIRAILHEYASTLAILAEYREALPEVIHSDIEVPVESTILSLDQESRISLAKLLREQEGSPQATALRRPGADQRLVRDSKKRYQLGRVRARTPDSGEEIVDLISPVDQRVVVSLQERAGSTEFEAIAEAAPVVPRPTRSLENLKGDARRLLQREPMVLQQARNEALGNTPPENVEARLTRQSATVRAVADKLRKALPAAPDVVSQTLLDDLEKVARRYLEQGRLLRIEMIKRMPPNESGIAWLHAQDQLQIVRIEGRIALKRVDDFLQEYVVKDKQGRVLAYAHFHYLTPTAADADFKAGHLKLPEQRFTSFRSLADKTDSDVVAIYYSRISAPMAERLFFRATDSVKHRGRRAFW